MSSLTAITPEKPLLLIGCGKMGGAMLAGWLKEGLNGNAVHIVDPFLERNNLIIEDVKHLIFHPGGKKILQTVEGLFGAQGKNINDTKEVLKLYGNMSSATVLYVLERFMSEDNQPGEKGLMLSFGPGFSAQRILLEW